MKRYMLLPSLVLLGLLLVFLSLQPSSVHAAVCYQIVGGGDGIVVPCPDNEPPADTLDPNGDDDGDGILNSADNCPLAANANQLNTWGGAQGDACEQTQIGNGGTLAFPQYDGSYNVYGDCYTDVLGEIQCRQLAQLNVCELPATVGTSQYVPNPSDSTQRVLVTLMERSGTQRIYQLNIQDANGVNIGAAFNITYTDVNCPELAPPPPPPTDTDHDGYLDLLDYCPTVAGYVSGCPNLNSYYAAVGITTQTGSSGSTSNNSTCNSGGTNVVIYADSGPSCVGNLELSYGTSYTPPHVTATVPITEAYCRAVYYQYYPCQAWANNSDVIGNGPPSEYGYDLGFWCADSAENYCNVTWTDYCSVVNDPVICGSYTSFKEYCAAGNYCWEYNTCVGRGYGADACLYIGFRWLMNGYEFFPETPVAEVPEAVRPAYCAAFNNVPQGCVQP